MLLNNLFFEPNAEIPLGMASLPKSGGSQQPRSHRFASWTLPQ